MRRSLPVKGIRDSGDMIKFNLEHKNSLIEIICDRDLKERAQQELERLYNELERYVQEEPFFLSSYEPLKARENSPEIARIMASASENAGVGPMAAVAGTFSELLGRCLLKEGANEGIVENGGDIFLKLKKERLIGIYSGQSEFSSRIALRVKPESTPLGVCTSSGSVGHSVSLGKADSVTVVAESCPLADAAATAIANQVKGPGGIQKGIEVAGKIKGIQGALIIKGTELGTWGILPEIVRV